MVERIARQPVAPEVTSRKRTIPFVYRPRIKKHQRRKTVINCLQPYPADTLANITLALIKAVEPSYVGAGIET